MLLMTKAEMQNVQWKSHETSQKQNTTFTLCQLIKISSLELPLIVVFERLKCCDESFWQ